jgi:hypothetical protein
MFAIHKDLDKKEIAMPDPRMSRRLPPARASSARDEIKASRAETEFQRVTRIARRGWTEANSRPPPAL